jgi:hypothetical protein
MNNFLTTAAENWIVATPWRQFASRDSELGRVAMEALFGLGGGRHCGTPHGLLCICRQSARREGVPVMPVIAADVGAWK